MDTDREILRQLLATLAFRTARAVHGLPPDFAAFRACDSAMSSGEILAHMANIVDWCCRLAEGTERGPKLPPAEWNRDVERFFTSLQQLDEYVASGQPLAIPIERLVKGPVADALTHTGQLAMMRRMAGMPMPPTNYFKSEMETGCIARMKLEALSAP